MCSSGLMRTESGRDSHKSRPHPEQYQDFDRNEMLDLLQKALSSSYAKKLSKKQSYYYGVGLGYLHKYGLLQKGWKFTFDHAKVRAGVCRYRKKTISIAANLVENAPHEEVIDTIKHEIAHALVPPGNGHNEVWRQMALAIGCNGERCHSLQFSQHKYVQKCANGCWQREVHRRRKGLICRFCRGKVIYLKNNPN